MPCGERQGHNATQNKQKLLTGGDRDVAVHAISTGNWETLLPAQASEWLMKSPVLMPTHHIEHVISISCESPACTITSSEGLKRDKHIIVKISAL
jgi:hypothetical protein